MIKKQACDGRTAVPIQTKHLSFRSIKMVKISKNQACDGRTPRKLDRFHDNKTWKNSGVMWGKNGSTSRPSTATTSIVTQSEPGPLTLSDHTGVFPPTETQAKTIPAITPIAKQAPTSSMASKASLTVKPGVGGSDTTLPGGVFQAGVETAPVFVPATSIEARSAADIAGVPRGTGFDMRNV
jgi:hypothetical protein